MTRRPIIARGFLLIAFVVAICSSVAAQQRPLLTEDVDIIPPGTVRIEAGIDFIQGAKYPVSGINWELTRVGGIGIKFGLGPNLEVLIERMGPNTFKIYSRGTTAN